MPASYVHQCVAKDACQSLGLFQEAPCIHALRAGAEGPDPFFFSFLSLPGALSAPKTGSMLHTQRTDEFLLALAQACQGDELLEAYCCGFFTHYATDTTFHPFVYAHSLTQEGSYSGTLHCTLEHQLETLHYRRRGHASGLPVQMAGFAALTGEEKDRIALALSRALKKTFPNDALPVARVRRSFDDAVALCRLLRSPSGKKFRAFGALLSPVGLKAPLHAHMMPTEPPQADIANDAHRPWSSLWTPDVLRNDSFDELYSAAIARAKSLVLGARGMMHADVSYATLRSLIGGYSYDSGLPWSGSCPAAEAPGVRRSKP